MKITGIEKLSEKQHLNLFEIRYKDKKNRDRTWVTVSRSKRPKCMTQKTDPADAAVIIAYHTSSEKLVLIKEFRIPLGDYQFGFPAGLIDPGETAEDSAVRELFEETGLVLNKIIRVGPPVYSSSGMSDESVSMVYAECNGIPTNKEAMDSEDIEPILVSREDAKSILSAKDNKFDVKTWLFLQNYIENGWQY